MKIYRLDCRDAHHGTVVTWHGSIRDAERARAEARRASGPEDWEEGCITPIDFSPTKAGVLAMLTRYAPQWDNG